MHRGLCEEKKGREAWKLSRNACNDCELVNGSQSHARVQLRDSSALRTQRFYMCSGIN